MTRAVFLDFYGTLAHAKTWGPTREKVLAARGFEVPDDIAERWVDEAADGQEHLEHSVSAERYLAWEHHRLRRFVEACGVLHVAAVEVADANVGGQASVLQLRHGAPGLFDGDRHGRPVQLVEVDVVGSQPRIFQHTLDRSGVSDPTDVVFVGDSWGPDVDGPAAMGMRPVHVWRPEWDGQREPPPPITNGVARLPDLSGLLNLV